MSLATNVANLATRAATELKAVRTLVNGNAADLSSLTTTAKGNLVAAINEIKAAADAAAQSGGAAINDAATATLTTWSSSKIAAMLPTWATISGKPAVVAEGATAAAARTAIGAGTSNLVVGTTAADAKAGNYQPTAANISDSTLTGRSVLTAADAAAARTAIGAGTSSLAIGTTGTTAAAGNDSRLSDARTPTAHVHAAADITTGTVAAARLPAASETASGIIELATLAEVATGTDTARAVTVAGVRQERLALKSEILGAGVPAALDTLDELAAALGDDANFAATTTTALGNRVRFDAAQTLTGPQQVQARSNIGAAGSVEVGDTSTDFVATFNAGLI